MVVAALEGVDAACRSRQTAWKLAESAPELLRAVCSRALAVRGEPCSEDFDGGSKFWLYCHCEQVTFAVAWKHSAL